MLLLYKVTVALCDPTQTLKMELSPGLTSIFSERINNPLRHRIREIFENYLSKVITHILYHKTRTCVVNEQIVIFRAKYRELALKAPSSSTGTLEQWRGYAQDLEALISDSIRNLERANTIDDEFKFVGNYGKEFYSGLVLALVASTIMIRRELSKVFRDSPPILPGLNNAEFLEVLQILLPALDLHVSTFKAFKTN